MAMPKNPPQVPEAPDAVPIPLTSSSAEPSSPPPSAYPDVDPISDATGHGEAAADADVDKRQWPSALDCIEAMERQAKVSHGLYPDTQLLLDAAAYFRTELGLPKDEAQGSQVPTEPPPIGER